MAGNGLGMLYVPIANYTAGHLSEVRGLLDHPGTVVSLADGGAHCTRVSDSAAPHIHAGALGAATARAGKPCRCRRSSRH